MKQKNKFVIVNDLFEKKYKRIWVRFSQRPFAAIFSFISYSSEQAAEARGVFV